MSTTPATHAFGASLALHTWSLDSTPLTQALAAAQAAGWDSVELRRVDFLRARTTGRSDEDVIASVRASGLRVACVGVEMGWLYAEADQYRSLLDAVRDSCRWARALDCPRLMSPADRGAGDQARARIRMREVGAIVQDAGLVLAFEFNSQAGYMNSLPRARDLVSGAAHPGCRLLIDTYHVLRSGGTIAELEDLDPEEIAYVQYSDVPRHGLVQGQAIDRLPPGAGQVPFRDIFSVLKAKGYLGPLSYEGPNPDAWARPPGEVAQEVLTATRRVLASLP